MKPVEACPEFAELERFVAADLPPASSALIRTHVTTCVSCSQHIAELRADDELADRLQRVLGEGPDAKPPTIAGYRVLREVGRGGMGVVYEAVQESTGRRVALKIVRGSRFVDSATLRLFQREIRVLARLEHEGIAALFDAGTTGGEHWFAMEFVQGKPLNVHLHGASPSTKLERFTQLCAAIDHAHQHGVVHRDLKPTNILATDAGRVQVLDFGLAKITDADVSIASEAGHIRGTLAYMSPEQARGDPDAIGLRSDVYSLGVILYELLCGVLPINTTGVPIHEAARRVVEDAPRKPSAVEPALRGDLETIVLKALEKDAHRRYASAAALAEDVRRYLADEVILARPTSRAYELKKLVARHRAPFALAATILVLALGATVWMSVLYGREADLLDRQRDLTTARETALQAESLARADAQRATKLAEQRFENLKQEALAKEASVEFLVEMFRETGTLDGRTGKLSAVDVLRRGIERLKQDQDASPYVRIALLSGVGAAAGKAGLLDDSAKLLEEGVALAREHVPGDPILASLCAELGLLRRKQGLIEESRKLLQEASDLYVAAEGSLSVSSITARLNIAQAWRESGEPRRAAELSRELLALTKDVESTRVKRLGIQSFLGLVLYDLAAFDEAGEMLTAASEEHAARAPDVELANLVNTLGMVHLARNRIEDARARFAEALEMRLLVLEPDHETLSSSYNNLAACAARSGDAETAAQLLQQAWQILTKRLGTDHPRVAQLEYNRAKLALTAGDITKAEELARHALAGRRARLVPDHPDTAASLVLVAELAFLREKFGEADAALVEAIAIYEAKYGHRHPSTIQARYRQAQCRIAEERNSEAVTILRAAVEDARATKGMTPAAVKTLEDLLSEAQEDVIENGG